MCWVPSQYWPPLSLSAQKSKLGQMLKQNIQHSRGTRLLARKLVGTREKTCTNHNINCSLSCTSPRLLQLNSMTLEITNSLDEQMKKTPKVSIAPRRPGDDWTCSTTLMVCPTGHLAPGPLSIGAYFEKRWSGYQETFGSISMTEIVSGAHF